VRCTEGVHLQLCFLARVLSGGGRVVVDQRQSISGAVMAV